MLCSAAHTVWALSRLWERSAPKGQIFFWDPRMNGSILSPQNNSQSSNKPLSCQRNYNQLVQLQLSYSSFTKKKPKSLLLSKKFVNTPFKGAYSPTDQVTPACVKEKDKLTHSPSQTKLLHANDLTMASFLKRTMVKTIKAEADSLGELQGYSFLLSLSALNETICPSQRTSNQALLSYLYDIYICNQHLSYETAMELCAFSSHLTTATQKTAQAS